MCFFNYFRFLQTKDNNIFQLFLLRNFSLDSSSFLFQEGLEEEEIYKITEELEMFSK